jgi:hypothetical protein
MMTEPGVSSGREPVPLHDMRLSSGNLITVPMVPLHGEATEPRWLERLDWFASRKLAAHKVNTLLTRRRYDPPISSRCAQSANL